MGEDSGSLQALRAVVGEVIVDATDRIASCDEGVRALASVLGGTTPTIGAPIAVVFGPVRAPMVQAAIARARQHGRVVIVLPCAAATYELDLAWAREPGAVRVVVRPMPVELGAGDDPLVAAALRSNLTEMIAVFDHDLRLRAFNELYRRGAESVIDRPLVLGECLRDIVRPQVVAAFESLARRALAGDSVIEDFAVVLGPGAGVTFEVSWNPVRGADGAIVGASLVSRNVTRRRDDAALAAAAASYRRAILDAMPDAFAIFDRAGTILDVSNPRDFPVPVSVATMVGRNLREYSHLPLDRLLAALELAFETGQVQRLDYDLVAEGAVRHRSARITRINDNEALWVVHDVTDDRRAAERLAFTDRMVSVGTLAAGVAHEINNPLQYVLGNVEAARALVSGRDTEVDAALSEALAGLERAAQIVAALKTFSRSGSVEPTSVPLAPALLAAVKFASHALKGRAVVEVDVSQDAFVTGAETALSQVFLNILLNAVDAVADLSSRAGIIRVRMRHEPDARVAVDIFNNGPPIPASVRAHIFDPFYTTKPVGQGTGLGLAIALQIARAAGGDITVESTEDGTTFTVAFPIVDAPREASARPASPSPQKAAAGAAVLVIDDDPHVARSLVRQLPDYRVTVAASAQDGVRALEAGSFDVVLCDVTMPGMSGSELYALVAEKWPGREQRFVMMSGGVLADEQLAILGDAVESMLRKPFSRDQLRRAVDRVRTALPNGAGESASRG